MRRSRNKSRNYSHGRKCSGCGASVTNQSAGKCLTCHCRDMAAKRVKHYQTLAAIQARHAKHAESAKHANVVSSIAPRVQNDYRLGFRCERCGGKRTDGSKKFCGPCYFHAYGGETGPATRMVISPWQTLPDGTQMRTIVGV